MLVGLCGRVVGECWNKKFHMTNRKTKLWRDLMGVQMPSQDSAAPLYVRIQGTVFQGEGAPAKRRPVLLGSKLLPNIAHAFLASPNRQRNKENCNLTDVTLLKVKLLNSISYRFIKPKQFSNLKYSQENDAQRPRSWERHAGPAGRPPEATWAVQAAPPGCTPTSPPGYQRRSWLAMV